MSFADVENKTTFTGFSDHPGHVATILAAIVIGSDHDQNLRDRRDRVSAIPPSGGPGGPRLCAGGETGS
ncbi:MAG: hypothetical protein LBS49_14815 [Candidatus Accumulibacter sp.]|jgi:hypothetical protein|nr:hypothetical protein [Accumulibacter sp.]